MGTECGKTDRQRTGGIRSLPVIEANDTRYGCHQRFELEQNLLIYGFLTTGLYAATDAAAVAKHSATALFHSLALAVAVSQALNLTASRTISLAVARPVALAVEKPLSLAAAITGPFSRHSARR
jgi:hypothetical protein